MVIIKICKKCKKENSFPDNRYKICDGCKNKNNKIKDETKKEIIKTNSDINIKHIYFIFHEIILYLSITDISNIFFTSKECNYFMKKIPSFIYRNIADRDFGYLKPNNNVDTNILFFYCLMLDTGVVCNKCFNYITECNKKCYNYKNISKSECLKYYEMTNQELDNFEYEKKYITYYRKYGIFYNHYNIRNYIIKKYSGLTNFYSFKKFLNEKREIKRLKIFKKKEENIIEFNIWKSNYLNSFDYNNLSPEEKKIQLDKTIIDNNLEINFEDNDTSEYLYYNFINGSFNDKSIDEICAIIKLEKILLEYGYAVLDIFMYECLNDLEKYMFKNRKKTTYMWFNAVEDVHKKYKSKFEKIRYIIF